MTIVLAKEFTGLEGGLGQTGLTYDGQGSSWGAANPHSEVLFCWIVSISGVSQVIGRIDGRGVTDDTKASPIVLSGQSGASGVRCCYNPATDGWVIVYNVGSTVYYRKFSRVLVATSSAIALPDSSPIVVDSANYNLGCNNDGYFYVSWPNRVLKVNTSNNSVVGDLQIDAGLRMHVHVQSGNVDLTRISGSNLVVDRYTSDLSYLSSIVVATSSTLDPKLHEIVSRYGGAEGFIVSYIDGTSGDNVHYRAFSGDGLPLYSERTVSGTGHIDISASQGRFFCTIGERPAIDDQQHTFVIRAASTNVASPRILALIEPTNSNPETIDIEEVVSLTDTNALYGQPVVAPNQYEIRHLKPSFSGTPTMKQEVYVRQSVWMSLWKIEHSARVFYNFKYEPFARDLVEHPYLHYPTQSQFAGDARSTASGYNAEPGRGGVDVNNATFSGFWGTATNEENIFMGGPNPLFNEISYVYETNPQLFDGHLSDLSSEIGVQAFEFFVGGRQEGWQLGDQSPEIRVTISGTQYILQRHTLAANLWYQFSNPQTIVCDYGIIIRLPLTSSSTQSDRAHIYIAGINPAGTRAAAYVFKNALDYKLGSSCAHLVVLEYDKQIGEGPGHSIAWPNYTPGTTGNIRVYPLEKAVSADFEGLR